MNKILGLILFITIIQINCQNKLINDLNFSNLFGNPKKLTELTTINGKITDKSVNYYSKNGYLIKIENYNLTKSEFPDKRFLNYLTTYNSKNLNKRTFTKINVESKKIESEGVFKKVSDSLYKRISNSKEINLEKLFYFDKNNKLIKTEEQGQFNDIEIKTHLSYFYLNKQYDFIYYENIAKNIKMKITYKSSKYDKMNNLVYYELIDENGNLLQKTEREIEYY